MNIFFLHNIAAICAMMHVDRHVVKMILESCQLLCSAHHMTNSEYKPVYKLTHKNHPCSIWTRTSLSNYIWLSDLALELCKEYTYRYGKVHKCEQYIMDLQNNLPNIPDIGFTTPLLAMPDTHKDKNYVDAYRSYYFFEKSHIHKWTKRDTPDWIVEYRSYFK